MMSCLKSNYHVIVIIGVAIRLSLGSQTLTIKPVVFVEEKTWHEYINGILHDTILHKDNFRMIASTSQILLDTFTLTSRECRENRPESVGEQKNRFTSPCGYISLPVGKAIKDQRSWSIETDEKYHVNITFIQFQFPTHKGNRHSSLSAWYF